MIDYNKRLAAIYGMLQELFDSVDEEANDLEAEQARYEDDLDNFDPDEEGAVEPTNPSSEERIDELRSALDALESVMALLEAVELP